MKSQWPQNERRPNARRPNARRRIREFPKFPGNARFDRVHTRPVTHHDAIRMFRNTARLILGKNDSARFNSGKIDPRTLDRIDLYPAATSRINEFSIEMHAQFLHDALGSAVAHLANTQNLTETALLKSESQCLFRRLRGNPSPPEQTPKPPADFNGRHHQCAAGFARNRPPRRSAVG